MFKLTVASHTGKLFFAEQLGRQKGLKEVNSKYLVVRGGGGG